MSGSQPALGILRPKGGWELDTKAQEFMEESLDSCYPHLFVDASYFKERDWVRYVSKALVIVVSVSTNGYREIFTFSIADAEYDLNWEVIFSDLKERGLSKADLIISEGNKGIQAAAETMFLGSSWQMCHVQFIRAVLRKVPRK